MNGEKKDLRYSRTDRLLQEAFLELLKVKSVDRITIRDLTERAGSTAVRSTTITRISMICWNRSRMGSWSTCWK